MTSGPDDQVAAPPHKPASTSDMHEVDVSEPKSQTSQETNGLQVQQSQSPSGRASPSERSSLNTVCEPQRALSISVPPRSGRRGDVPETQDEGLRGGEGDEVQATLKSEREREGIEGSSRDTPASSPRLSVNPARAPNSTGSPSSHLINAQPGPSRAHRLSLASPSPDVSSPLASPRDPQPLQNIVSYHHGYEESPRSPLQWRQTFEEAVRASSGGCLSPVVPVLRTPTPAPAAPERRAGQGSGGGDEYFASRTGSADGPAVWEGGGRSRSSTMGYMENPRPRPVAEQNQLHGLGFGTPMDESENASPEPFETVSLDSSSDIADHKEEGGLPPIPTSARSRSFAERLSIGTVEPDHQSVSSSRRVSVSSVVSSGHQSFPKSPIPRKVSAGLWGDIESENSAARRTEKPGSPLVVSINGTTKAAARCPSTSLPMSREPSVSSRRPSVIVEDQTPKVAATPRMMAPPAIPHDADPAMIATLSKPGASSLALAETGDPFTAKTPSSTTSHQRKSLFGLRTSTDMPSPAVTDRSVFTPASQTSQTHHGLPHPAGPSMLDQVRSQTRMVHLPPKPREEDEAHLESWKSMMEESRAAAEHRRTALEERRLAKERQLAADMPIWEAEILNPAIGSSKNGGDAWSSRIRDNPKLRAMWFRGVPSHLRGKAWSLAIGNDLTLSKDAYRQYHSRATRAIKAQRFPRDILGTIEHDVAGTLPVIKIFQPGSPMHDELKDLLCAWYISRLDEGQGYMPDIHHLAGMLLMTMNLPQAFIALRNLLNRSCLRAFYSGITEEVEAYYRIFENLQGELFPKIYANCKHLGIRLPSSYFTTIFIHQLSFEAATRVWDVILLEGDSHIFRIALAILAILEPRLYFPDRKEIISILEGSNQASLAIVARERERAKQKGLPYISDIDGVLTCLGVTEDAIFETLQHDDWKESRFNRLCQRELPDD